ncbi:MAG: YhdH/YhfP family quinone oxidoreductase [Balneolaceae bacterium]
MNSGENRSYSALQITDNGGLFHSQVIEKKISDLPDHDVLVRVYYSSLNYKDALSATGNRSVTEIYPHTPGIDAAGVVEESRDSRFKSGDPVIVTSYDLGMNTPGGFGQYIRVPGNWIVPLPEQLSLKESMIIGTAGFTASYGILKITEGGIHPDDGPVVVTGATGGVGCFAVALLSQLGYEVIAITGKLEQHDFLKSLGAAGIEDRDAVTDLSQKMLLKGTWAAAVDTVGAEILDTLIRQTRHNGIVTCCGNILGHKLHTNIYPFILRGVSLMGIDSGNCLMQTRIRLWEKLAGKWKPEKLQQLFREVPLKRLPDEIDSILKGNQIGRVLVNLTD